MADLTRTVEIIFAAVDNTGGAIRSVGTGITSFSSAAADAIAPLDQLAGPCWALLRRTLLRGRGGLLQAWAWTGSEPAASTTSSRPCSFTLR